MESDNQLKFKGKSDDQLKFDEEIRKEFRKVCYNLIVESKKKVRENNKFDPDMDEEDITKQLFRFMDRLIDENTFPEWPLDVSLDPNIETPSRLDEDFPAAEVERIDIYIKCVTKGPRRRFSVECKKLDSSDKWRYDYYCDEGIGRFVEKIYAEDKEYAAIVSYIVSNDSVREIVSTIKEKVKEKDSLNTERNLEFEENIRSVPTYISRHHRENLESIELRHIFLKFA